METESINHYQNITLMPTGADSPLSILLVEDNEDDAFIFRQLIRNCESRVLVKHVLSIEAANDALHQEFFDVICLDLNLPGSSGLETLKRLSGYAERLPIVILSGLADKEIAFQSVKLGAQDFLAKGTINADILEKSFRYAIERKHKELEILEKNQAIEDDLGLASEIQQAGFTELHQMDFLNTTLQYLPHSKVSGDLYDVTTNSSDFYNIFLGDATGHGVSAALITMLIKMGLRHINTFANPNEIFSQINQKLTDVLPDGKFVTAVYVRITPDGRLSTTNAGHPPLIILPGNGEPVRTIDAGGMPLGVFNESTYPVVEEQLHDRDKVFIVTDGVLEVINSEKQLFGVNGLTEFFDNHRTEKLKQLPALLLDHVKNYTGGTPFDDDVTVMGIEYLDPLGIGNELFVNSSIKRERLIECFQRLKKSRMFKNTPDSFLKQLVPVSDIKKYHCGETILSEGQKNERLYILISGCLGISAQGKTIFKLQRTGDVIGEMSTISGAPCTATVYAEEDSDMLVVDNEKIQKYDLREETLEGILYKIYSLILNEKLTLTTRNMGASNQ